MTTSQGSEYRNDGFSFWNTHVLMDICFRVTPVHERDHWVITSVEDRYQVVDGVHVEMYDLEALRAFAVEQLEDYGITEADINRMKS